MRRRRPMGALEAEVLSVLWRADGFVSPAAVREALSGTVAYTTVTTVLTRLWRKGLVERVRVGRTYTYRTRLDEAGYAATGMHRVLAGTADRSAAIARFVGACTPEERELLRRAIEELER